jgi:hypothetical protein
LGSKRGVDGGGTAVARRVEFLAVCECADVVHRHGVALLGVVGAIARLGTSQNEGNIGAGGLTFVVS